MKKAQSISINTIVVAAIALTVIILVILITTGSIGNFRRSADSCESNGGECLSAQDVDEGNACNGPYQKVARHICYDANRNPDTSKKCCIST